MRAHFRGQSLLGKKTSLEQKKKLPLSKRLIAKSPIRSLEKSLISFKKLVNLYYFKNKLFFNKRGIWHSF